MSIQLRNTRIVVLHEGTRGEKDDLFPDCATLLLADGMNLVQDDAKTVEQSVNSYSYGQGETRYAALTV